MHQPRIHLSTVRVLQRDDLRRDHEEGHRQVSDRERGQPTTQEHAYHRPQRVDPVPRRAGGVQRDRVWEILASPRRKKAKRQNHAGLKLHILLVLRGMSGPIHRHI